MDKGIDVPARAALADAMAGAGIESLNVRNVTPLSMQTLTTAAMVFPISPGTPRIDEDPFLMQRLEQRRQSTSEKELQTDLEECDVVSLRTAVQSFLDCGYIERNDQTVFTAED